MTLPRGDGEVVSNTRVAVRVRPMTSIERDLGAGRCLNISGAPGGVQRRVDVELRGLHFDHVGARRDSGGGLRGDSEPAPRAAWDGYDVGVMAYGQMGRQDVHPPHDRGRDDRGRVDDIAFDHDAGLIPRIGADLFARVGARAGAVVGGSGTARRSGSR